MKKLGNESGQTMVLVALGMAVTLGFVALATDIGVMLHEKNLLQSAADSAAIAGAMTLHYGMAPAATAARNDAALNGFTDGSNGVTVTVSDPPTASEVANPAFASGSFIKVSISKNTSDVFMKLFNRNSMVVSASAIATNAGRSNTCIYVLDPTDPYAMQLQGSFQVSAPSCNIRVNSTSGDALHFNGTSGTLVAKGVYVVGGDSGQTGDSTPVPILGVKPADDPLLWLPPPTCNSWTTPTNGILTGSSVGPGCYNGNVTVSNATLSAGTYVFNGNVSLAGTVSGSGVTLFLSNGDLSATTNSSLQLSAPATGIYSGILIFDDSPLASPLHLINLEPGNATGTLVGIIYAPFAELYVHDSGGDTGGGTSINQLQFDVDFVVYTFMDQTGVLNITSYTQTDSTGNSPLTSVTLVQ